MLDIYNQMKAEKMHSRVSLALVPRDGGVGSSTSPRFNRRSGTARSAQLPKTPRSDLSEGLELLVQPRQGHGGTVPKSHDGPTSMESLCRKQVTILLRTNKVWLEAQM